MKHAMKKLMIFTLTICILFSTACGNRSGDAGDVAMGRYVEDILDYPDGAINIFAQLQRMDGSIDVYYSNLEGNGIRLYNTKDGETWKEKEVKWEFPQGLVMQAIKYGANDQPILLGLDYAEDEVIPHIYKEEDGSLIELTMKWNTERTGEFALYPTGLAVLQNGDILVEQAGDGIVQYSSEGDYKHRYDCDATFMTVEDKICITDIEASALLVYDAMTYELINSIAFDGLTTQSDIAKGQDGAIYIYNSNGVFRILAGGNMAEKIIDGELTSLSMPTIYASSFVEKDGVFYMIGVDSQSQSCNLLRYRYDTNMASRPGNELVVYTLYENQTLRQAAGSFHRKNPDTKVNIQVGVGDDAATESDQIRTLNTELLAGKGPDIILLDGMNPENYIEKEILMDLTKLMQEIKSKNEMIEPVIRTFEKDKKLYAVPINFWMPVLFTEEKYKEDMGTLTQVAAFAQSHQDLGIIGGKTPENLMRLFLPASAPDWLSGKTINEKTLSAFLEDIKAIADTKAAAFVLDEEENISFNQVGGVGLLSKDTYGSPEDIFHWAFGRAYAYGICLSGLNALDKVSLAFEKKQKPLALPLPGSASNVFIPTNIIGINAKTQQEDAAKDFVKLLLSEEIQKNKLYNGFPVNIAVLEKSVGSRDDVVLGITSSTREGEELVGPLSSVEEQNKIIALCLNVKTPYIADLRLEDMIIEAAAPYFAGEKRVEEAVADIKEKTKLYLSE